MQAFLGRNLLHFISSKYLFCSVDDKWSGLVHALSGQFCSSINFVGKAETTHPLYSFKPLGVWPVEPRLSANKHLRYATLPRETVCTENLTPWKKLLPCGGAVSILFS